MLLATLALSLVATVVATEMPTIASDSANAGRNSDPLSIRGVLASQHPVSVVEADIYVKRFSTTMRLKCFAEDLEMLQGVEVLEDGFYDSEELLDATKDHAKYLAEKVQLIDSTGVQLKAKITEIVDIEFPDDGEGRIPSGQLMSFQIGFSFEYSYEKPPEFLTINQQMIAEGALLPSELKVLLKQAGSDQPYIKMLKPDKPETFRFDWDKPALNSDASEKEWEEWFNEQREKSLGITSYSSVYSFIYITHTEVRHEVLIPLATLATMIEFERAETSYLDIDEQDAAAEKIKMLFSVGNPVKIDSVEVKPVFDRIDFYGLDLRDFAVQAEKRKISMANGRVGLILSYSTKGTPREVDVTWDKFNSAIKTVDSVVFVFDKVLKTKFSMFLEDNTYRWSEPARQPLPPITDVSTSLDFENLPLEMTNHRKIEVSIASLVMVGLALLAFPVALFWSGKRSVVLGIAAILGIGAWAAHGVTLKPFDDLRVESEFIMPPGQATDVFIQLHKNMFRAFDYRQESDIYDALANSVEGDLLRELFLKINESLKVREQGGAVSRIDNVEIVEGGRLDGDTTVFPLSSPGFYYHCRWNLVGSIEHWGHLHQRTNQYDADFKISLVDDAWKITDMNMIGDPKPGVIKTSLRKF